MGISFYWWITCFDQASQHPPFLFFTNLSWYPKPAKLQCIHSGWQASMRSVGILHPSPSEMVTTFSYKTSASTSLKVSTIARHSCLDYCAFNQHWGSILTSLPDRRVLTYFVTDTSACNLEKDSFNLRISTTTFLFTSSSLSWSNKSIGIRTFLLISRNDSFV